MYKNLNQYIAALESCGELIRITAKVDPLLEVCEITDRISKSPGGGKALLFENTGTPFPILTNMLGSQRRITMALGVEELEELPRRIEELFVSATSPKRTMMDKLRMLPMLGEVSSWMPRSRSGRGECQQVVMEHPDITKLPVLGCWPHDGGRFVTLPLVHTVDPHSGVRNIGMYRMQIFSPDTTGMHWHRHKTGERHYQAYKELGQRMPVTVCMGGDPAYTYSATAPLPDGIDEYMLAGFLRRRPVELVRCLTNELEVPADCDFVIEGYVDPTQEKVVEGDFGDHTGFYSLKDLYPEFHITCITHRRGAIYPATIVGVPPQEDAWIARATEQLFLAPIRMTIAPEMVELTMPEEGVAHNIAICSINKSYPGQGFKIANAMWGAGQMMFNKLMVVTSASSEESVSLARLSRLIANYDPERDTIISRGTLDVLDHAAPATGFGGKICIDLTDKLPQETSGGVASAVEVFEAPEVIDRARIVSQWRTVMICAESDVDKCDLATKIAAECRGLKCVVIYDSHIPLQSDLSILVWLAAGNCDAWRDTAIVEHVLVVDARSKPTVDRPWPNPVTMDMATISRVDARWQELGLGEFIYSPSARIAPLVLSDSAEIR